MSGSVFVRSARASAPTPVRGLLGRGGPGAVALAVSCALALTACGSSDDSGDDKPAASEKARPKGLVTPQEANRIVDEYERVNNAANKKQDAKLLHTVEGGQSWVQSNADYEQFGTRSAKEKKDYTTPFFYRKRTFYIPAGGTWFAMRAESSNGYPSLVVFDKEGGRFKVVASVGAKGLPELYKDADGLAEVADGAAKSGRLAPEEVAPAYEDLLFTGGTKQGRDLSKETEPAKLLVNSYKKRNEGEVGKVAYRNFEPIKTSYDKTYALKTKDGGVVAVSGTSYREGISVKLKLVNTTNLVPNEQQSVYNPDERIVIRDEHQGLLVASLPKQGLPSVEYSEYELTKSD
ncbi:hypothetical protein HUT18_17775 [Streptomyces sp. NA04227]|uniref:hypothetical protein n=1 Tax=Streptomyces sp. NA04227 TaxID=2742136 RepID=UPI00159046C7|nr:hypothetical protein [Streptomyces sp. NA04227]QKW07962.1 hypothetical protein HUT18_17775 [Streptomyces sp. NA04227]